MNIPSHLQDMISYSIWEEWTEEQKSYIIQFERQKVELPKSENFHANYSAKHWELDHAKPSWKSICEKCNFPFLFYAKPRNYSLSHTADVWNLTKCANSNCGILMESCS